ncbi:MULTISPECIES: accessory gene regulator B family protein [Paenibacillus]|uniref:accessory gene regulator B family protein n=1 Tax=Paenibacillus TaxID=44249 RepID=UPI0038733B3E
MKCVETIRNNYEEAASEKVLFYALSLLINTVISIISVLLVSYLTNHFIEAIIAIICFLVLRNISGGFHLNSSLSCCIFTIIILIFSIHINISFYYVGIILNIISLIIVIHNAPRGLENVSRLNPKYYIILKLITITFLSINFFFESSLLSVIFFVQSLTLTNTGYLLVASLERRWDNEKKHCKDR